MTARRRLDRDLDRELEHHLAESAEFLIEQGLPPDDARAEAARRLGSIDEARRRLYPYARDRERRMRLRDWMQGSLQDLRLAARGWRREPGLAAVVVATLALGIGANAAIFGIVDRLLLRGPDHVREADRVMRVYYTGAPEGRAPSTFSGNSYAAYVGYRDGTRLLEAVAAYGHRGEMTLGEGVDAERVQVRRATWTFFPLLGVVPERGRFFRADEDAPPNGQSVAVLGHGLWTRRFGADAGALGQTIILQGQPYTVIGVAPEGFTGAELEPVDVWIPASTNYAPTPDWPTTWNAKWLHVIARLAPGVGPEAASDDAAAAYRLAYTGSQSWEREHVVSLQPLGSDRSGGEPMAAAVARWLTGVAAVVLLVACANVANLLLARGVRRRREIALRAAFGITPGRLVRLLAAELVVLGGAGAVAALAVAYWSGGFMRSVLLPEVAWSGSPVDARVLVFTAGATLLTLAVVGLAPVLQARRIRLTDPLRDGAPQAGSQRSWVRGGLTVAQAALSVALLVGAGLFVESLLRIRAMDLGLDLDRVLVVSLQWRQIETDSAPGPAGRTASAGAIEGLGQSPARRRSVADWALPRLRALPGIEAASAAIGLPFDSAFGIPLRVEGVEDMPSLPGGGPYVSAVAPDYFQTVGTSILEGRAFGPEEGAGTEPVVIVNESMARAVWPDRPALGRCLHIGDGDPPCSRVVGVAEDTRRFRLEEDAAMQYYVPMGQERSIGGALLIVRPGEHAGGVAGTIRRELIALEPSLAYVHVMRLQDRLEPQLQPWRLGSAVFSSLGVLALLIAAIGLYSVIAYTTSQRTREIGVRLALGARRGHVLRLIVVRGLLLAAAGIAAGVLVALAAGPWLEPLLFETSARSVPVFALVTATLLFAALVASILPAHRAAGVDPAVTLRG